MLLCADALMLRDAEATMRTGTDKKRTGPVEGRARFVSWGGDRVRGWARGLAGRLRAVLRRLRGREESLGKVIPLHPHADWRLQADHASPPGVAYRKACLVCRAPAVPGSFFCSERCELEWDERGSLS